MKKITWFEIGMEINKDKKFYINGLAFGIKKFYGPYTLVDANRRVMKNHKGNEFMHYAEDFWVEDEMDRATGRWLDFLQSRPEGIYITE